jgi:hypothetical protein
MTAMMIGPLLFGKLGQKQDPDQWAVSKIIKRFHGETEPSCPTRCAMRTMILAATVILGSCVATSQAQAQMSYIYGNGAYPVYPSGYTAQTYCGGISTPAVYGGNSMQTQPAPTYFGASLMPTYSLMPASGIGPSVSTYAVPAGSSLNGGYGYTQAAQYGYRAYGTGRTFSRYVPRIYSIYQPRRGGVFDR